METLSRLQAKLLKDIIARNKDEIYVLGSTQSGKTYDICLGVICYAEELYAYDREHTYYGAIIGWSIATVKGNIADVIVDHLKRLGRTDWELHWGGEDEKYLRIRNIKFYFYGFNTTKSYNRILGKPLIFEWVDESARIYSSSQLQNDFDQLPTRQMSYVAHPYYKTIHSFNVEGNERHPYKLKYIDGKPSAIHYTFFPYDNPKINTKEAMLKIINTYPKGSALLMQKVYNEWVISEGLVFTEYKQCIIYDEDFNNYAFREIGIGIDYGSRNPTTFVPLVLAYNNLLKRWEIIRLEIYYHIPTDDENPTTEYYSNQLRLFMMYLKNIYGIVPITDVTIDSEATHFHNRLIADNIPHNLANKYPGSVVEGVQRLQTMQHVKTFRIYEHKSLRNIHQNGDVDWCERDEGIMEFESYQYDTIKSSKVGVDCYKKEWDHQNDGIRYEIESMIERGVWYDR